MVIYGIKYDPMVIYMIVPDINGPVILRCVCRSLGWNLRGRCLNCFDINIIASLNLPSGYNLLPINVELLFIYAKLFDTHLYKLM